MSSCVFVYVYGVQVLQYLVPLVEREGEGEREQAHLGQCIFVNILCFFYSPTVAHPGHFFFLKQFCVLIIAYGGKHGAILVFWKCLLFVLVFAYVGILGLIYCYNQTRWESVYMVWSVGSLHGALRGILLWVIFVSLGGNLATAQPSYFYFCVRPRQDKGWDLSETRSATVVCCSFFPSLTSSWFSSTVWLVPTRPIAWLFVLGGGEALVGLWLGTCIPRSATAKIAWL